MMRITGYADIRLSRRQKFYQLRVAFVELRFVGCDLLKHFYRLVVALILVFRQTQQDLKIPRLSAKLVSPFWISEVLKGLRLVAFLDAALISSVDEILLIS